MLDNFRSNSCPLQKYRLLGIKIFVKDIGMKRKNLNESNSLTLSDPQKHNSQLYAMRKSKMLNMLIQKKLAKQIWQNITEIQIKIAKYATIHVNGPTTKTAKHFN